MKKLCLLSLFVLIALLASAGCSVILRQNYPKAYSVQAGWTEIINEYGDIYSSYEIKQLDASVRLGASYRPSTRIMWWGPPLLPLVPKFLYTPKDISGKLTLFIQIESRANRASIDISKIRLQAADGRTLQMTPSAVFLNSDKLKEIPTAPTLLKGKMFIYLAGTGSMEELSSFVVDLGSVTLNNENIKIPPIEYRKKAKYIYGPVVVGDHLEG